MSSVLEKTGVRFPFPGLRPFREGEEHLFFGRECQTDAMIDKLAATRFLTVIGTSGSGKSSLVNCGLCLGLHSGLMPEAGTKWRIATCRPGENPIASLAQALAQNGVLFDEYTAQGMSLSDIIETNLRMSKMGLIDAYDQARLSESTNLLIIVDQFEELFRFRRLSEIDSAASEQSRDEATAFVKLLLSVTERTNKRVYVVLTMRSDFLGDCTEFEGLAEAINQGQYLVPRMTREQRRLAITGPIGVAGARIDDVLLTRLINDPGDNPDQLSILQHALNRIWAHWSANNEVGQPLGMQNYNAVGSMSHALDRHAEKAYAELQSPRQKQLAENLFKALTDKTLSIEGIRRPTSLQTLCDLAQCTQAEMIKIIDVFRKPSRSFLMPPITEELSADTVIDISHESLMRMWQRLVTWSDEEAVSTQTYRRLAATAELYEDNKAGLWRDPDLQLALQWRQRNEPNAIWASQIAPGFDQAMRFLDASRVKSDEEKAEQLRVAEQSRELEHARAIAYEQEQRMKAQKSANKRQRSFLTSVIAGLVATIGLGVGFWQKDRALDVEANRFIDLAKQVSKKHVLLDEKDKEIEEQKTQLTEEADKISTLANSVSENQKLLDKSQEMNDVFIDAIRYHQSKLQVQQSFDKQALQEYVANSQKINDQVWQLVKSNVQTGDQVAVTQSFINQSDQDYQIYRLNDSRGLQSDPVVVASGATVVVEGIVNQIWIARALPDFTVTATGIWRENAKPQTLQ